MATRGIHRKEVLIMFKYDYSYLSVLTIIKDAADNTIVKTAALVALIDSYANKEAERILITNFSDSVAEEKQLNFLEHKLLNLFDALKFEQFKKRTGLLSDSEHFLTVMATLYSLFKGQNSIPKRARDTRNFQKFQWALYARGGSMNIHIAFSSKCHTHGQGNQL